MSRELEFVLARGATSVAHRIGDDAVRHIVRDNLAGLLLGEPAHS